MSNIEKQYQGILRKLVLYGTEKEDRTGTGTLSYFGEQIRHNMEDGFPLLTTKKMAIKTMMTELKWFLKGDTNIKYLVDNGCNIWNGDAYKAFKSTFSPMPGIQSSLPSQEEFINKIKTDDEFAKKWGELGPIYGAQWRDWKSQKFNVAKGEGYLLQIDQIAKLIVDLKKNPDSRRLMVSAWNVGEIDEMVLPPCHYGFQVYTRELSARERTAIGSKGSTKLYDSIKEGGYETIDADIEMHKVCDGANVPKRAISLMWNQRSVDTFLGLPFNIASYGLLLEMLAKEVNMIPDQLIGNLGDVHLYSNHIEQAKEQIERRPMKLPTIEIGELDLLKGSAEIELKNYLHHSAIKAPLSN